MRVVGYVRASTAEAKNPGLDPAEQRQLIEDFAAERGWTLAGVSHDIGLNARAGKRPALKRLLDDLSDFDTVVVARLDRLGESARRVLGVLDRLSAADVSFVSLHEGLDTGSHPKSGIRAVLAVAAGWETGNDWAACRRWQPGSLLSFGFSPETVVDVGAADGTPALTEAFPGAHHVMIEPLVEYESDLRRLAAETGADYLPTAVGSEHGTTKMLVNRDSLRMSSALTSVTPRREALSEREVPVTTLDVLMDQEGWKAPFGLKIDTEGFERPVVEGATRFLRQTDFVIAETSLLPRFEGSASSRELIALLGSRGFEVLDVLQAPEPSWADVLFGRKRAR